MKTITSRNNTKEKPKKSFKTALFIPIFQLVCAIFFALVLFILYLNFRGEFVIIAENLWIFLLFGASLIISAAYTIVITITERKSETRRGLRLKNIEKKTKWLIGWSIWNLFIGILLIFLYGVLLILVADMLAMLGLLFALAIVLAIPFIGYSVMLIYSSVRVLLKKIKSKTNIPLLRGMTAVGFSFLFLVSAFSIVIATYNPQWTEGVDYEEIFVAGEEEGRGYRIPAMLSLPNKTVLAFCESRADPFLDWGDIDLVMKRSTDNGKSWSKIKVLVDEGDHTAGNPCPVYDKPNNMVWLPFCVDNKDVYVMNSSDLGKTWSKPREITNQLDLDLSGSEDPLVMEYGTGPGCGIQLSSGRLCIPSYYFDERGSHIIYSDDNGTTWERGEELEHGGECQAFETMEGEVCLNCRTTEGYRYVAWSEDGGETWEDGKLDKELPSPGVMASIHRFTQKPAQSKNRVLYSSPGATSRGHLILRMSEDEAESWDISREIYSGPSAYSQIVVLADLTICILFETGKYDYREQIVLVKVDLDWLEESEDETLIPFGHLYLLFLGISVLALLVIHKSRVIRR